MSAGQRLRQLNRLAIIPGTKVLPGCQVDRLSDELDGTIASHRHHTARVATTRRVNTIPIGGDATAAWAKGSASAGRCGWLENRSHELETNGNDQESQFDLMVFHASMTSDESTSRCRLIATIICLEACSTSSLLTLHEERATRYFNQSDCTY